MIMQLKMPQYSRNDAMEFMGKSQKTERLFLRPAVVAVIDEIMVGLSDFDVARMMEGASLPFLRQDALELLGRLPHDGDGGWTFALTISGDEAIGLICLRQVKDKWLLQYWLNRPHWGNGYMGEALGHIVERFFATFSNAVLCADVYADDVPALHVQQKLGFKITGSSEIYASIRSAMVVKIHMQLTRAWFADQAILPQ